MTTDESRFGFDLLDPENPEPDARRAALAGRRLPPSLGNHKEAAKHYQPDDALVDAVNVSLAVGAPLLLTGEPGTGKTQAAYYLGEYFGIEVLPLFVRSDTTAEHLVYGFDAVAYLHAANEPRQRDKPVSKGEFVEPGPLWQAYRNPLPTVVLIDEIDKASRDFPNDLLNVLDQHRFHVRERDEWVGRGDRAPPVVVITSNSERRLPEPFLRRCIVHHIAYTEELVRRAVSARLEDFQNLDETVREAAIARFQELRRLDALRKKPATAELLVWLAILSARGDVDLDEIRGVRLADLPALSALIKDRDDRELLAR